MTGKTEGKVKWFGKDKGYGFIYNPKGSDFFFHVSQVEGEELPSEGDMVSFEIGAGKHGKPAALNVVVVSKKQKERKHQKPYYATNEYEYYTIEETKTSWALKLCAGFGVASFWLSDGLFPVALFFSVLGAVIGWKIGSPKREGRYEITSTCLRCGGTGHVTARSNNRIGFQCDNCRSTWNESDKHY